MRHICVVIKLLVRLTTDGARAFLLHVTDVVELGEERILRVDGNHFPVKLSIINHRKYAQDLYLKKYSIANVHHHQNVFVIVHVKVQVAVGVFDAK